MSMAGVRVEVSGRLVGQQDQRPVDERAGDRDPLLLATGELVRAAGAPCRRGRPAPAPRAPPCGRRAADLPITSSANATFSTTVLFGSSRKSWNTQPIARRKPRDLPRAAARPTSRPSTKILPLVGTSSCSSSSMNVDLPEPDGPMKKTNSPFSIVDATRRPATGASTPSGRSWSRARAESRGGVYACNDRRRSVPMPADDDASTRGTRITVAVTGVTCCCLRQRMPASMNPSMSPSKHRRRVAGLVLGAQVLDHLVRVQHVGAHLVAPASRPVALSASILACSSCRLRSSSLACSTRIAAALFCSCDFSFWQDTTMPVGQVGDPDRRVGGVDALAARARTSGRRRPGARSRGCRCGRSARPPARTSTPANRSAGGPGCRTG